MTKSQLRIGLYVWATLIGMIAGIRALPSVLLMIKSITAMFTIALAVYIYNDLFDIKLDKISADAGYSHYINRPLVTGKASKLNAKIFIFSLMIKTKVKINTVITLIIRD